ncbi:hypothetical protein [Actinopolymorpha pittospori]|uniref:Uncharacterized protein n=1 Tax=Actinopolymorpha pittospori TaxID=648752 RepID=A0A927R9H0_9ACTN|nr:hypothetical protein [Actinopolymorpha pittospori]MBE1606484.1 hypothetical protein [Actinopolymorpha pittospori]
MTELWPGFSPTNHPVALFDGERTWLFRHPSPPEEFRQASDAEGALVFDGRHPAVVGSSLVDLGGVTTATVLQGDRPDVQAEIAHETFHVFCRVRHPAWAANEVSALTYPVEDPEVLTLRRLEAEALRRAVLEGAAGWAVVAASLRQDRFERLPESAVRYERDLERYEGLAFYVEGKWAGAIRCVEALATPSRPDDIRRAAYHTGEAMAVLLDKFAPGWADALEANDTLELDGLLRAAVAGQASKEFSADERAEVARSAREAVAAMETQRRLRREAFLARHGRIVLTALSPNAFEVAGYDPMNIEHLGRGEVLHTRFLKLRGEGVELEVFDSPALTESAGAHPLHDGIRRVTFTSMGDAS